MLGEAASLLCAQVPGRDLLSCCLDAVMVKDGLAVDAYAAERWERLEHDERALGSAGEVAQLDVVLGDHTSKAPSWYLLPDVTAARLASRALGE